MGIYSPLTQNLMPNKTFFGFFTNRFSNDPVYWATNYLYRDSIFLCSTRSSSKEVKKCDPFGCTVSIVVDNEETTKIKRSKATW